MKRLILCMTLFLSSLFGAEDIGGFWKIVSTETGKPQCIIAIYEYEGLYYGRIIASYDEKGKMDDTIYAPSKRAPGVIGNPFYSGLDIIWGLADRGMKFKGKILDPEHGDVYNSEVWMDGANLVVRGKLFIFGRSQVWYPAKKSDFPSNFKVPNLKEFVPSIPNV